MNASAASTMPPTKKNKNKSTLDVSSDGRISALPEEDTKKPTVESSKDKSLVKKKKKVSLKSSEGKVFEVEEAAILQSQTIKHMIEAGLGKDVIPLANVNGDTLRRVINYCRKHSVSGSGNDEKFITWDAKFMEVDQKTVFELMLAANYLDIKGLLDLTCKTVADRMVGKTVEQLRHMFGVENDFTPEEEKAVRSKNAWAFVE